MKFKLNYIWFLFSAGLLLNIIAWWIVAFLIRPTSGIIALHYNVFYGTDLTGSGYYLYAVPLAGSVILLFNYLLYRRTFKLDVFIANTVAASSLASEVFVLIAVFFLKSRIII
jgi:hypothetical protein